MDSDPPQRFTASGPLARSGFGAALILGGSVFLACIMGIYTRPEGLLASIWPANAVMLGILLRLPASAGPLGWLFAGMAFMLADLQTGSGLVKAGMLNAANLAGVVAAYGIYRYLPREAAHLRQPLSMLQLVFASAVGAAVAGVVGGFANPVLFGGTFTQGWAFWFATEFANYIAILPVILAAPPLVTWSLKTTRDVLSRLEPRHLMPIAALILSCLAAFVIGGPGALAFPVPALLWCGLAYGVFPTTVLTLLHAGWTLVIIAARYQGSLIANDEILLVSLRLGASLIALAPIMLSCVMLSRNDLLDRLQHLASHDELTGFSSRRAFYEQAGRMAPRGQVPLGVLMIDIDHFKQVNDTHGHPGGDDVLRTFAERVKYCLRASDLIGRLGGEEFGVVIGNRSPQELSTIAERIRESIGNEPMRLPDGGQVQITASIGMVIAPKGQAPDIERLLAAADTALYQAKSQGRNRVVIGSATA